MTAVTLVFVGCLYLAVLISKIFNIRDEHLGALCMWMFLVALVSIFGLLASQH